MATPVNVFGTAKIQVSFFNANLATFADPVDLGYTENGVNPERRKRVSEVQSDETGGQAGFAFDYSVMGEQHAIRLALSRFDQTVLEKMWVPWSATLAEGMSEPSGLLAFQDKGYFRLAYGNNNIGVVYPKCVMFIEPFSESHGTQHDVATAVIVAHSARISTTVSQVETITWKMRNRAASMALAWASLSGLAYA